MAKMLVAYKKPQDPAAFDKHYFQVHVPLTLKIPGVRKYEVSKGPVTTVSGDLDVYLVGTVHFDSLSSIQEAFASAEGQAAAADARTFIADRLFMLLFDDEMQ